MNFNKPNVDVITSLTKQIHRGKRIHGVFWCTGSKTCGSKKGKTQFNSDVGSLACYANKLAMSAEQQILSEPISYTVFSVQLTNG